MKPETPKKKPVVIESPLAGDESWNSAYARLAMRDSLARGEAPFASHLLFPMVISDNDPQHRNDGMLAGFAIGKLIDTVVVYTDLGITSGMKGGITRGEKRGATIEMRSLGTPIDVERAIIAERERWRNLQR